MEGCFQLYLHVRAEFSTSSLDRFTVLCGVALDAGSSVIAMKGNWWLMLQLAIDDFSYDKGSMKVISFDQTATN